MAEPHACPVCGLILSDDGACRSNHAEPADTFTNVLEDTLHAMEKTALQLRELALRMDRRGDALAAQVHEQAQLAEDRAARIREQRRSRRPTSTAG